MTGHQDSPTEAIVARVHDLRAADLFGRITVLVPSFGASRDLVRALARSGGVAGVAVRTASQVVAELAGPALAPRAPLPFPLLAAAVERALDADSGRLESVADQQVTSEAVARACLRLGTVEADSVTPETPLHREVLRLAAQAQEATTDAYYPEVEAVEAAVAHLDRLGQIVLAAPLRGTAAERRLRTALEARGIAPVPGTGTEHLPSAADPAGEGAVTGTHVVHASDSDDEVRAVVRFVRSRLAVGVPGHRIGVYFPSPDPYLRLLLRAFVEADITVNGPSTTHLGRSPAGRSLVRLLRLDRDEVGRAELLSILAEGAVSVTDDAGHPVSSRRLEKLTRTVVPVLGGRDWQHLAHAAGGTDITDAAASADAAEPAGSGLSESDRAAARALVRLVGRIREVLDGVDRARTWSEVAETLGAGLTSLLRPGPDRAAVEAAVHSLGDLDLVAPGLTRDRVVGAVATRLDSIGDRVGEEGVGVSLGPIDDAVGRDLDTVCVVGMAEGLLPVLHRPDPLLPEGAVEPARSDQLDERYRVLQSALAAGREHRLCSFPRGSMRGGGDRIPSRWLLPTLSTLTGTQVKATQWEDDVAGCPHVSAVASFAEGALTPPDILGSDPATPADLRLRAVAAADWTVPAAGPDLLAPDGLRTAHEMRRDRRFGRFTRFTGDVSGVREHLDVLEGPVSPTRLEDWAQSPYLFFLTTVLRVRTLDEPAAAIEMDLRDYGELVHTILERYVASRIEHGHEPDRDLLTSLLHEESRAAVAGAPGLVEALWRRREDLLDAELDRWFEQDTADAEAGWRPLATEQRFGRSRAAHDEVDRDPQLEVPFKVTTTAGPRTVLLSGSIDRLDQRGGAQRVTDYKTGKAPGRGDRPRQEDPTLSGTRFQLPLYAAAAAAARDLPVDEVRYWYCTDRGGFDQIALQVTDELMDRVREDVGHLIDAVDKGWFPLKGGRGSARDLTDLLGGADLDHTWERLSRREPLATHPAFAGIVADPNPSDA